MSDPIEIELQVEGTSESAAGVDAVADKLQGLEAAARQTSEATDRLTRGFREEAPAAQRAEQEIAKAAAATRTLTETTQGAAVRVQQAQVPLAAWGSAISGLAGQLGGLNPELDALQQMMGAVSAGMATAASMPGPWGMALGGLTTVVGIATSALRLHSAQVAQAAQAQRDAAAAAAALGRTVQEQEVARIEATITASNARILRLRTEGNNEAFLRESEYNRALQAQREEALRPIRERQALDRQLEQERAEGAQRRRQDEAFATANAREMAEVQAQMAELETGAAAAASARAERERRQDQERRAAERAEAESFRLLISEEASWFDQQQWQREQNERASERAHAAELRRMAEAERARQRAAQAEERAVQEKLRLERELEQMSEKRIADYQQLTGVITDGLTEALVATIAGTESADEAFKGMLASFLAALSQMAGLEAAKNYARAIEFFSTQRYDQGALAIAAGTAWLAVAVASGAGSVAVSAPPAAAAPASPQSNAGGGGEGGGSTTIVHFNAPTVTAGTRAELGREVAGMIDESRRRL